MAIFRTIRTDSTATFKEKKSEFVALVRYVETTDDVRNHLDEAKTTYPGASHYCFAYILDKQTTYASDAGEPSGSAGMPILRRILAADITHTLVIVLRFYGGVKLGVPGLIKAYGNAAGMALEMAGVKEVEVLKRIFLDYEYSAEGTVQLVLKKTGATILDKHSDTQMRLLIGIAEEKIPLLKEYHSNFRNFTFHEAD